MSFGELFNHFRVAMVNKSLRAYCAEDLGGWPDAAFIVNLEKGRAAPPATPMRLKELCLKFNMTDAQFIRLQQAAYEWHLARLKSKWSIK